MTGHEVDVVIDELVLHGFEAAQREQIAEAVRGELATRLAGWFPPHPSRATDLDAGSFSVPAGPRSPTPEAIGRDIARQVGDRLTRGSVT